MAIILEDYKSLREDYLDVFENGEYHVIPPINTHQVVVFWRDKDIAPTGTIKFMVAGDEGSNPDEGTIDLAQGKTTVVSEFRMYALDIVVSGLPSGAKLRLYFTEG